VFSKSPIEQKILSLDLKTDRKSLMRTVCGSEFQTDGAENQKARLEMSVLVNVLSGSGMADERKLRLQTRSAIRRCRYTGVDLQPFHCQRFLCRHPVSINMPPIRQFSARGRATLTFTFLPENMNASYKHEANTPPTKVEVSTTYRF